MPIYGLFDRVARWWVGRTWNRVRTTSHFRYDNVHDITTRNNFPTTKKKIASGLSLGGGLGIGGGTSGLGGNTNKGLLGGLNLAGVGTQKSKLNSHDLSKMCF